MSHPYPSVPAPDDAYWPGYVPPNTYGIQDAPSRLPNGDPRAPSQYVPLPPHNNAAPQYWAQDAADQYPMSTPMNYAQNYTPGKMYPQYPPQSVAMQAPQHPYPIQQQLPPQQRVPQQYQQQVSRPSNARQPAPSTHVTMPQPSQPMRPQVSNVANSARNSSDRQTLVQFATSPTDPAASSQMDHPMLLISLAEEYLDAAHQLAPSVAVSMTTNNVEEYQKLIATALGCLETTLKNIRLPPRAEARIRLRYACVLHEETNNFIEAETCLSKGIILCERVRLSEKSLSYSNNSRTIITT